MSTVRASNMLATMLVAVAIVSAGLGWSRTAAIAVSGAVYLLIRSVEILRASNNRPEN
jgi:hypothetical protein